jgi:hypothetical protein
MQKLKIPKAKVVYSLIAKPKSEVEESWSERQLSGSGLLWVIS